MRWTENSIRNVVAEFAEENALACRALFKISEIRFDKNHPTLAVSLADRPILFINPEFCNAHMKSENDLKACLLHEFLHILLQHTDKYSFNTPLLNIAADAIINSIIHRSFGEIYSGFFNRFYKEGGLATLLRSDNVFNKSSEQYEEVHKAIYSGKICADDLHELLNYLLRHTTGAGNPKIIFIGNHSHGAGSISEENKKILDEMLKKMDGVLIWNRPNEKGIGDKSKHAETIYNNSKISKWKRDTYKILKKFLTDEKSQHFQQANRQIITPVLNSTDKRALAKFKYTGLIPFAESNTAYLVNKDSVNIYLDVSGSMDEEIDALIALLHNFRKIIRYPLWVFSDDVYPAEFKNKKLVYKTTNGTQIACVFDHIRKNKIKKCLIVTDGYIESIKPKMLTGIVLNNIHAIVSAFGSTDELNKHGIKYHQLKEFI
jgi:predicted metal-dependent peptidase